MGFIALIIAGGAHGPAAIGAIIARYPNGAEETLIKKFLLGLLLVLALASAAFVVWGLTPQPPGPAALAALQSSAAVQFQHTRWLEFSPTAMPPTTGLVFYPGGHVDARAYAPLAQAIAARGYLVVIAPMPLALAVLNPGAAQAVIAAHPEIRAWAVGGHSLGGVMAANFAARNPQHVQGLVLWASYPAETDDLSARDLPVLSISGALDEQATPAQIDAARPLLPASTLWLQIAGGVHAGFADYGDPGPDRDQQWAQTVQATADFLAGLGEE